MEVLNSWVEAIEQEDPETNIFLWTWSTILIVALAGSNFLNFSWQLMPFSGSRGIYPAVEKQKSLRANYPLWRRLVHFPHSWFAFIGGFSDTAIRAYPWVGMALTGAFCLLTATSTEQSFGLSVANSVHGMTSTTALPPGQYTPFPVQLMLLWAIWFFHAIYSDLQLMPFPWHNMTNESLLILALSWTTCLSAGFGGGMYPSIGVTAIRILSFRILFGFGKTKFLGAEWRDWKYIKPFIISVPCASPYGLTVFRWAPDWCYAVGYFFFFFSECVIVFAYFAPSCWWRVVGCLVTLKLMIGIHITTNFGNFNIITALACLAIPLPVTGRTEVIAIAAAGPWWYYAAAGAAYWALVLHMIGGLIIMPFNSWISGGWHQWPVLLQIPGLRQFNYIFEVAFAWRACQAYGVFPPNISATQRQVPLFEGSRDGKTWEAYRYNAQPTQPDERNTFMCGRHPSLEFTTFYPIGAGFLQSSFGGVGCVANFESRIHEEVAKNLINGGDAADLFRVAPFPKSNPPKYLRVVQLVLIPETKGSPNWWKVVRTQQEVATFSAETRDTLLPKSWVADVLIDTEPGTWIWRQRVTGRLDEIRRVVGDVKAPKNSKNTDEVQQYNDARALAALNNLAKMAQKDVLSPESQEFIMEMKKCQTLEGCCNQRDQAGKYVGVPVLQREIHREALLCCDILITCGWPWHGENKPRMAELRKDGRWKTVDDEPFPIAIFQLYLYCLHIMANPPSTSTASSMDLKERKKEILEMFESGSDRHSWYRSDSPVDPAQLNDGLRLVVGLYPRTLRLDASANRRWSKIMSSKNQDMRGGDMVLPGYQAYWRGIFQKSLPMPSNAVDHGNKAIAASVPGNIGGYWGEEWRLNCQFNDAKSEYDCLGFSVGDHRLPSAEKMVLPWEEKDSKKKQ